MNEPAQAHHRRRAGGWRPLAAAVLAAVIAGGGAVACGGAEPAAEPQERERRAASQAPAATGPARAAGDQITVFLCVKNDEFPTCHGKGATAGQKKSVRDALTGFPGVERVDFQDQEAAYRKLREQYAEEDSLLVKSMRPEDLPESYVVTASPSLDSKKLLSTLQGMPGVGNVVSMNCVTGKATC
ncbi:hypothetical protein HNP84_006901 [Thermocatellispora tengchongensis]|uniref:FtsX extracellular domain-containing protein n=1 Tax=Thermocatellispora tengchongensis TaxID=1073253 RepID=A0A840PDT3_9ACTN|nr:permease-like cell division protein FtsX [Thermocatellispora tengchongensis]MBB5137149.1 hypothetical protein [Thermocatellispora tengchongensis]